MHIQDFASGADFIFRESRNIFIRGKIAPKGREKISGPPKDVLPLWT